VIGGITTLIATSVNKQEPMKNSLQHIMVHLANLTLLVILLRQFYHANPFPFSIEVAISYPQYDNYSYQSNPKQPSRKKVCDPMVKKT